MSDILQQIYSAEQEARDIIQKGEADVKAFELSEQENTKEQAERIRSDAQARSDEITQNATREAQKQTAETLSAFEQRAEKLKQSAGRQKDAVADELLRTFFGI